MGRVLKPDVIDKILGVGVHENYQEIHHAFTDEQSRAYVNENRYSHPWAASLRTQLQSDLAFAEKVEDDYTTFLEQTSINGTANILDGENILDIFILAISVLNSVNDLLDDMYVLGFIAMFTVLIAVGYEVEARALQAKLKRLYEDLSKAKREVVEAYVQTALDVAITGALACMGPLGWLTLGGIGLGQMVFDTYVGPSTSDAATWGNRGATTLGTAASASQKYLAESSKVMRVAKPAGKVFPVIGFAFDVNEIAVGYKNVDYLKRVMAEATKAQDKLLEKIKRNQATFSTLSMKIGELQREVEKRSDGWVFKTRQTLDSEVRRTGYRPKT